MESVDVVDDMIFAGFHSVRNQWIIAILEPWTIHRIDK